MTRQPKEIMRSFIERYQDGRDARALAEFLSPEVVDHTPLPGTTPGAEGVRQVFEMLWSALPDMRVKVHQMVAEGDTVVTRKSFVGTHRGELFGVPPTGKDVHLDLIDIVRVSDGKIVEHWNIVDSMGLMQQLGAVPA
jgi:steroid delta-isomerase-like uncharacterized protein